MSNYVRYSIVYNPRNRVNKYGKARVSVCAYLRGEGRQYFYTGVDVAPSEWDSKRRQINAKVSYSSLKNAECAALVGKLVDIEMGLRLRGEPVSVRGIRQEFYHHGSSGFLDFVKRHLLSDSGCSAGTLMGRRSVFRALSDYAPKLLFSQITPSFVKGFEQYLFGRNMKAASVSEYLTIFRVFVRSAVRMGYLKAEQNPFQNFSIRRVNPSRKGISESMLAFMEKMQFDDSEYKLRLVRDLFLFSSYTGLRFSDVVRLKSTDICQLDGKMYLRMQTRKTGQTVCVPLNILFEGKALELLEAYRGQHGEYCFPSLSNNRVNEFLKVIGQRMDPPQHLTFHQARHSFACFLANRGANPYTIKFLMGHASIQTSMIYVHTSLSGVEEDLLRIVGR